MGRPAGIAFQLGNNLRCIATLLLLALAVSSLNLHRCSAAQEEPAIDRLNPVNHTGATAHPESNPAVTITASGVKSRALQGTTLPPSIPSNLTRLLPNVTLPPGGVSNFTLPKSTVNVTSFVGGLNLTVPANLSRAIPANITLNFIKKLENQTIPLLLACASNKSAELVVCFKTWEAIFNKSYVNATEEAYRYSVFVNNTKSVVAQNQALVDFLGSANQTQLAQLFVQSILPGNISALLNSTSLQGFTAYSDLTPAEFAARFTGLLPPPNFVPGVNATLVNETPPQNGTRKLLQQSGTPSGSSSWVSYASDIRNQSPCNSCWVFSTVASLEILNSIAYSALYTFSEQEIIDCLGYSCPQRGFIEASSWVAKNRPALSYEQAPFEGRGGDEGIPYCPAGTPKTLFQDVYACAYSWTNWKLILDKQPTFFYVHSSESDFKNYQGANLYTAACPYGSTTDHVVVAVGYDSTTDDEGNVYEYVIIRNSWGEDWGDGGYGYFVMTINGEDLNLCGSVTRGVQFHRHPAISLPTIPSSWQCYIRALSPSLSS